MSLRLLRERLVQDRTGQPKPRKARPVVKTAKDHLKTPAMRLAELQHGRTIEELLTSGSLRQVAKHLRVDFTTVSKWRTRLNLNYTPGNLPVCEGCIYLTDACAASGVCHLLLLHRADVATHLAKMHQLEAARAAEVQESG